MFVPLLRPSRQKGGCTRGVLCDRSAQQNSPEHSGKAHLPLNQVRDSLILFSCKFISSSQQFMNIQIWTRAVYKCPAHEHVHFMNLHISSWVFSQDCSARRDQPDVRQCTGHCLCSLYLAVPRHDWPPAECSGHQQNHSVCYDILLAFISTSRFACWTLLPLFHYSFFRLHISERTVYVYSKLWSTFQPYCLCYKLSLLVKLCVTDV